MKIKFKKIGAVVLSLLLIAMVLSISVSATNETVLPDFIEMGYENLSGDLWNWNSETKTLTLYDNFETANNIGNGVSLPAGSTVLVNSGDVYISATGCGIYCEGELNIKVKNGLLNIESNRDAIVAQTGNINIDDSEINIECAYDGIAVYCGDINITDSDITILSGNGRGVVAYDSMVFGVGNVNINGGRLQIVSFGPTLIAESGLVSLEDVTLFLAVNDDTTVIGNYYPDEFSIPGYFSMLDKNGKYIVENKQWSEDYLRPLGGVFNPDGSVTRASAIVTVASAEKNNGVVDIKSEYAKGDEVSFTAKSDVLEYPVMGNTSWFPTSYKVVGTNINGEIQLNKGSFDTSDLTPDKYVLEVAFEEYVYFGDQWLPGGENYEVVSIDFIIQEAPVIEPTPPIQDTDTDDKEEDIPSDIINPIIPDTSFESNVTSVAMLTLTISGAFLFTHKRKRK